MARRYLQVKLRHIGLRRGGRAVLRDVDWSVSPRQRWILAGSNGAGKTQLLKLVAGSVWPSPDGRGVRSYHSGSEVYRTPLEVQEEIAYVGPERQDKYERYGWDFAVWQVVGTGLNRTDIPLDPLEAADRRMIARLLERLSLAHLAERRFLTLSYGERRLVLLARALAARPKLLLLDELLAGLDGANHAAALAWLEGSARSHMPWVLATHRLQDVPRSATHALLLERGRIVYRGRIARAPLGRWLDPPPSMRLDGRGEGSDRRSRRSRSRHSVPGRVLSPRSLRGLGGSPGSSLVRLSDATVYLDGHPALEDLSLEVARGECWVVHGPNGSGKSTLLRTIYGDHAVAVGGRIERAGIEPGVALDVFKRNVGFVAPHLQSLAAATRSVLAAPAAGRARAPAAPEPRDLTVSEVVQSGRHASMGLDAPPNRADRQAAERSLAAFGLATLAQRTLRELSYGQLRRVFFARAWVDRPRLLLLDEPFSGIDAATRGALLERLDTLVAGGTTVVMATHHREEWPRGATHELELRAGRVRYRGPVRTDAARVHAVRAHDRS